MKYQNINSYKVEDVAKMFSRKQLAIALVATTNYTETISQQYTVFKTKENMVSFIIDWLDECDEVEDLIKWLNANSK